MVARICPENTLCEKTIITRVVTDKLSASTDFEHELPATTRIMYDEACGGYVCFLQANGFADIEILK